MRTYSLPRPHDGELVFFGEHLITVDDREWLGITPNWWELSLYRVHGGGFVLASVYYQNYPRGKTVCGAWELPTLDAAARCLRLCGAPEMIIEALLLRTRRVIQHKDHPRPPLRLRPTAPARADSIQNLPAHALPGMMDWEDLADFHGEFGKAERVLHA